MGILRYSESDLCGQFDARGNFNPSGLFGAAKAAAEGDVVVVISEGIITPIAGEIAFVIVPGALAGQLPATEAATGSALPTSQGREPAVSVSGNAVAA